MTGRQTAPRSAATRSGGGAPTPLIVETFGRIRDALEALEGRTTSQVTPFVEDLEGAADALEAVNAHLAGVELGTPPPRPAPRHDTAVASAVGVLADAPA